MGSFFLPRGLVQNVCVGDRSLLTTFRPLTNNIAAALAAVTVPIVSLSDQKRRTNRHAIVTNWLARVHRIDWMFSHTAGIIIQEDRENVRTNLPNLVTLTASLIYALLAI